jgi:hypothetical protein
LKTAADAAEVGKNQQTYDYDGPMWHGTTYFAEGEVFIEWVIRD